MKLQGCIDAALPLVLVIAMTAGCCRQAVRRDELPPAERPWCASFAASTPDGPLDGEACVTTRAACEAAVSKARSYGSLAGVRSVGDCNYRTGGSR